MLIYASYALAGLLAMAVYWALPKEGRLSRPAPAAIFVAVALGAMVMLLGRVLGQDGNGFYVCLLSVLAIFGAIRVVTHAQPVYSALYFILVVLSTAALVLLVGAEFLAAALVIIYAGAILVTYVFVIMMAQQSTADAPGGIADALAYDRSARKPASAVIVGFVMMATVAGLLADHPWPMRPLPPSEQTGVGNTLAVGRALLTEDGFPVSLQVAGVLLMVAMVGAIMIARRRLPGPPERSEVSPPGEIGKNVRPF